MVDNASIGQMAHRVFFAHYGLPHPQMEQVRDTLRALSENDFPLCGDYERLIRMFSGPNPKLMPVADFPSRYAPDDIYEYGQFGEHDRSWSLRTAGGVVSYFHKKMIRRDGQEIGHRCITPGDVIVSEHGEITLVGFTGLARIKIQGTPFPLELLPGQPVIIDSPDPYPENHGHQVLRTKGDVIAATPPGFQAALRTRATIGITHAQSADAVS